MFRWRRLFSFGAFAWVEGTGVVLGDALSLVDKMQKGINVGQARRTTTQLVSSSRPSISALPPASRRRDELSAHFCAALAFCFRSVQVTHTLHQACRIPLFASTSGRCVCDLRSWHWTVLTCHVCFGVVFLQFFG